MIDRHIITFLNKVINENKFPF